MNYKDIEIFLELVRTRNITKTAANLFISQSSVSTRLKALETELGCQLISRAKGHRNVDVTWQGREFIPLAEQWKLLYDETEQQKNSSLSSLRIAVNESTYYIILAPFLTEFYERHPGSMISVIVEDSEQIYEHIEKNYIDCGFASYESLRSGVSVRCIDSQPLCVIRREENPVRGKVIDPHELDPAMEIHMMGGYFGGISKWHEKWFGLSRRGRLYLNSCMGILPFLRQGGYWCIAPLDLAESLAEKEHLQIYEIADQPEEWKIYFLKRESKRPDASAEFKTFEQEFMQYMDGHHRKKQTGEQNDFI